MTTITITHDIASSIAALIAPSTTLATVTEFGAYGSYQLGVEYYVDDEHHVHHMVQRPLDPHDRRRQERDGAAERTDLLDLY